jgi:ABC-type multidrug transport system fused ATPase/permease subunit
MSLKEFIRRFLPYFRPYTGKYILAFILLSVSSLLTLIPPVLVKYIIDTGIKTKNFTFIDLAALALIGVLVVIGLTSRIMDYLHEWAGSWIICDLRDQLLAHMQRQSMAFFASTRLGEIVGRLRTDVTRVYSVLVNTVLGAVSETVQIVGIAGFLFYLNIKLAIVALLFIPPICLCMQLMGRRQRALAMDVRDRDVFLLDFCQELFANIHVVKLFNKEKYMEQKHHRLSEELIAAGLRSVRYKFVSLFLIGTLAAVPAIVVIWMGSRLVISGSLTIGSLFAFYLYVIRFYAPVQSLANRGVEIYNGLASAQRIAEYFDLETAPAEGHAGLQFSRLSGNISFENVTFRYPNRSSSTISDLSMEIRMGEKVAIVGTSGAGKSTIVNLLCRLYDPDQGKISIDGCDIKRFELETLRNNIGVVSQEIFLFNDTIGENIRFGNQGVSHEQIIEAAKAAHLHTFIESLPQGYQTAIGSRGVQLSGGQRQRLALARMLLQNPKIWVLDEFTASLDSQSEVALYENIASLVATKTVIVITHRLSTILLVQRVFVLQEGRMVEQGSHHDLYVNDGVYRQLFEAQLHTAADINARRLIETDLLPIVASQAND